MKKIVLVVFYFGKFPDYFPLFLKSCKNNPEITWKIYTDNVKNDEWPSNVEHILMSFEECRKKFQSKFPFEIRLDTPRKLCDFKPAYGYILEEELKDYDFWGYCDIDMIFGNIMKFIEETDLQKYHKLYELGHFTLYKNDFKINRQFMAAEAGKERYKEVYQNSEMLGFDEWGKGNINDIFKNSEYAFLEKRFGADIWPERTIFMLSWYDEKRNRYVPEKEKKCLFYVEDGHVFCCWKESGKIMQQEYPYVHMQKRVFKMPVIDADRYYIVPGKFDAKFKSREDAFSAIDLNLADRKKIFDKQFWKIKIQNLKRRIKTRNFKI